MTKKPAQAHKEWTLTQNKQLRGYIAENMPTRVIAFKMKRTPAAIYNHAAAIKTSLKPVNQRPYNRRKK